VRTASLTRDPHKHRPLSLWSSPHVTNRVRTNTKCYPRALLGDASHNGWPGASRAHTIRPRRLHRQDTCTNFWLLAEGTADVDEQPDQPCGCVGRSHLCALIASHNSMHVARLWVCVAASQQHPLIERIVALRHSPAQRQTISEAIRASSTAGAHELTATCEVRPYRAS
jgi:hypothetical protein